MFISNTQTQLSGMCHLERPNGNSKMWLIYSVLFYIFMQFLFSLLAKKKDVAS